MTMIRWPDIIDTMEPSVPCSNELFLNDLKRENKQLRDLLRQEKETNVLLDKSIKSMLKKITIPGIKQVIYNGATTVMLWEDGEKTICKLGEGETFDRYTGFMACICKRIFGGTTTAKKLMNEKDPDFQAAKREAEALKAKEKSAAEQVKREAIAAARREKAHKEAVRRKAEEMMIEEEAFDLANEWMEQEKRRRL